jgi:hypothetical protein
MTKVYRRRPTGLGTVCRRRAFAGQSVDRPDTGISLGAPGFPRGSGDYPTVTMWELESRSLVRAMEKRYAEDERALADAEVELAILPPRAASSRPDIDAEVEVEVEAALTLFDEIERLADDPTANEAINATLERIGLRIGLFFEEGWKGTRKVRRVARGIIALGDLPLPVPLYGEASVLPAAALDPDVQRKLAAAVDGTGQAGATAPEINSGAPGLDHGEGLQGREVAARRRDGVPVEEAAPSPNGEGRGRRPTGTVPEGIVPSRSQLAIAAAGLEPATPGL